METDDKEDIEKIKNSLRSRLQQTGVNSLIRHMVRDVCTSAAARGDSSKIGADQIVQELYKRGLMKTVLDSVPWSDNLERVLVEDNLQSNITNKSGKVKEENKEDSKTTTSTTSKIHIIDEEEEEELSVNNNTSKGRGDELESENSFLSCEEEEEEEEEVVNHFKSSYHPEIVQEVPHDTRVKGRLNGKYYLKFEILQGRGFLDQLLDLTPDNPKEKSNFILHLSYKAQRFYTKPTLCQCEPKFQHTCMIDLGYFEDGTVLQLLTNYEPIRIILLQEGGNEERKVLSYTSFDWRSLLMSSKSSERLSVSLMGIGPESQVPVGALHTKLTILPSLQEILSPATFAAQINAERSIVDERERLFLIYVRNWWREFVEIRPQHSKRLVKIFSYDENNMARPIQTFVKQIGADRLLLTPFHAAWFVSLISLRKNGSDDLYRVSFPGKALESSDSPLPDEETHTPQVLCDRWQSLSTTVTSKSGRVEDHATLLCSLLLGFGLDAYVAIGTMFAGTPWVWVVTLDSVNEPTFWESTTGSRHLLQQPTTTTELLFDMATRSKNNSPVSHFKTISCLFNDRLYYANIQTSNLIDMTDWDMLNPSKWKKIPESTLKSSSKFNEIPPELIPSNTNPVLLATDIEIQLKTLISETRMKNNLHTYWDNSLGKVLGQELAKYEMEVCSGMKNVSSYFESVILKKIPDRYEFKGYPYNGKTRHSPTIFRHLMRDSLCGEIILCRGNDVKHSLRVCVFCYPEEVTSVRLMLACTFIPSD